MLVWTRLNPGIFHILTGLFYINQFMISVDVINAVLLRQFCFVQSMNVHTHHINYCEELAWKFIGWLDYWSPWMGFLYHTVTWYKIRHAGWQKNAAASKTKRFPPAKRDFPLFWMSQCVACHPAGEILYHLTASRKGPIRQIGSSFWQERLPCLKRIPRA